MHGVEAARTEQSDDPAQGREVRRGAPVPPPERERVDPQAGGAQLRQGQRTLGPGDLHGPSPRPQPERQLADALGHPAVRRFEDEQDPPHAREA